VASFAFNGSGSVAVTIHGDGQYGIAEDEVCEAVVPLAALDSCAPSDPNASVVLALITVIAPRTALQRAVAATTTVVSALSGVASGLGGGGESSSPLMAAMALMPCAPPSIRATYGVYRALSVVALNDSLLGVLEGTLIVLGAAVALGCCALAVCMRRRGTWAGRLAAARCPNYPFAVLTVLHLPMSYAAVVVALGSAAEAAPWQRGAALVVAVVVLIAVPLLVVLASALLVPRRFHAHVADASDWVQARLWLLSPSGHVAPVEVDRALGSVIGKFRVRNGAIAAVPFVPSLLLCAASLVSPTTAGGCVAVFASLLVAFAALIPMYLLLRPYRWPGLNVACAANTAPVLGLLGLMIAELQRPMGGSVDSAIAVLLAAQSALAAATVVLSVALLLLSMRMDPARCLGEVLWTAPQWSPRCIGRFLWEAKDGVADPVLDASVELQLLAEDDVPEVMEDVGAVLNVKGDTVYVEIHGKLLPKHQRQFIPVAVFVDQRDRLVPQRYGDDTSIRTVHREQDNVDVPEHVAERHGDAALRLAAPSQRPSSPSAPPRCSGSL
jgi:hypothetical protein